MTHETGLSARHWIGVGRLGGAASMEDFLEYKQIVQNVTPQDH